MTIQSKQKFFRIPISYAEKMEINEKYNLGIANVCYVGAEGLIRQALRKNEPDNPKGLQQIPIGELEKYRPLIEQVEPIYFEELR